MGRVVAEVLSYPELVDALRARRLERGLTLADLDWQAGLPSGYASKIEMGRNISDSSQYCKIRRKLGWMSLPTVLGALGLRLALVEVDEAPKQERAA